MARIPRAEQMGLGPSAAQQTRTVVDVPVVDNRGERVAAAALDNVGKTLFEFGTRLQEAQVDREIVTASRKTREELDKAQRDLADSGDVDPAEFETRFKAMSDEIIKRNGASIPGSRGQAMWAERAGNWQLDGTLRVRDLTRKRQLETENAKSVAEGAEVERNLADLDADETVVTANYQEYRNYIEGRVKAGTMPADVAAETTARLDVAYQKAFTERRTFEIDAMIQANDFKGAKAHLYDHRKQIDDVTFRKVEAVITNKQNGFEAQTDADKYWDQGKGYQGAMALARKEPDIEKRQKIEQNIGQRFQQEKAVHEDQQDGQVQKLWDHVRNGGTIANASSSLLASFDSPGRFASVQAFENARDSEAGLNGKQLALKKLQSASISDQLLSREAMPPEVFMNEPATWSPRNWAKYQAMTPDDQVKMDEARRKMRDGKGDYSTLNKVEGQLLDLAKTVAPKSWGLNNSVNQRTPETERLLGELRGEAARLQKDNGSAELTPDQLKQSIAKALKRAGENVDEPFVYWNLYSANMDPRSQMSGGHSMQYQQAFDELKAASGGIDPDLSDVEALLKARGQYGKFGEK